MLSTSSRARLTSLAVCLASALTSCGPASSDLEGPRPIDQSSAAVSGQGCSTTALQGIDVYDGQGSVNWTQVAGSGRVFAYAKATQGNYYQDAEFPNNWPGIKAAGMYRGAYHFLDGTIGGKAQADYFLDYIGGGATNPFGATDLPPLLDWECNAASCGNSGATSTANYITVAQDFINEVQARTGKTTLVYTFQSFWDGLGNPAQFSAYPLDFAWPNSGCPPVPAPWTAWTVWQWGVLGAGQVPGVASSCDVDVFNGDSTALATFAGGDACTYALGHPVGSGGKVSGTCGTAAPNPPIPTACGAIPEGDGLTEGKSVKSCDGRFTFIMQTDGNLVLYADGEALWNSGTSGNPGAAVAMQSDGNFVIYSAAGCPLWASNTGGHAGASLAVQNDGNVVIYDGSTALWSSGSGPIASPPSSGCGTIPSGDGLGPGDTIEACGGCFKLIMQTDGNLVLYKTSGGAALWSSQTGGQGGVTALMRTDGNLVVYSSGGCILWQSNTGTATGAHLAVQDDGNLVIYGTGNAVEWDSASVSCSGGCTCAPASTATASSSSAAAGSTGGSTHSSSSAAGTSASSSSGHSSSSSAAGSGSGTSATSSGGSGATSGSRAAGGSSSATGSGATHGATVAGSTGGSGTTGHTSSGTSGSVSTTEASSHSSSGASSSASEHASSVSSASSGGSPGAKSGGCSSSGSSDLSLGLAGLALCASRRRRRA